MLNYRKYGQAPFSVVLVHGGPGAAGELAPVAEFLSDHYGVLETLQTQFSIEDLLLEAYQLISSQASAPVVLAGYSWGAWLSVMISARYPALVRKLILISSGPFEKSYTRNILNDRMERINKADSKILYQILGKLDEGTRENNEIFEKIGHLLRKADTFKPAGVHHTAIQYNYAMYESIWPSAAQLRDSGELLSITAQVQCPVTAIHGDYDPHPWEGVKNPLAGILKDFHFILLERCGHSPWKELHARKLFYKTLQKEIES